MTGFHTTISKPCVNSRLQLKEKKNESSRSNHFEITKEITEFCLSGFTQSAYMAHAWNGFSQSSRFLPQAKRIVRSGDENGWAQIRSQSLRSPLTSGRKTRALGATISGMRHRCRLRSETGWAEFSYFLCYFKMVAPRALVSRPLVKGNEDSGNEIGLNDDSSLANRMRTSCKLGIFTSDRPLRRRRRELLKVPNHARYSPVQVIFCSSWKHSLLKWYLGKNLTGRKCRAYRTISHKICGKIALCKTTWT